VAGRGFAVADVHARGAAAGGDAYLQQLGSADQRDVRCGLVDVLGVVQDGYREIFSGWLSWVAIFGIFIVVTLFL
jgi:hypothetical protein